MSSVQSCRQNCMISSEEGWFIDATVVIIRLQQSVFSDNLPMTIYEPTACIYCKIGGLNLKLHSHRSPYGGAYSSLRLYIESRS